MSSTDSASQNPDPSFASATPDEGNGGPSSMHETVEKVRRTTAATSAKVKETAADIASAGKSAAADQVAGYSDRLRGAARSAEESNDPNIAHFAGQAADRLEKVADYVRDADFNRLREDASQVARRHPGLFMGGMLVAGLVLGNLAKASFQSLGESGSDDEKEGGGGDPEGRGAAESRDRSGPGSSDENEEGVAAGAGSPESNAQF